MTSPAQWTRMTLLALIALCPFRAAVGQASKPAPASVVVQVSPPALAFQSRSENLPPEDVQDILFAAESGPILIRLHIRLDGKPFRTAHQALWDNYVQNLFRHLDRKGAGTLDEAEARRLPSPQMFLSGAVEAVNVAFNFSAMDTNSDGKITLEELKSYYEQFGIGPLHVRYAPYQPPIPAAVNEALFDRLDKNQDGKLSREELAGAPALLDLDQDRDDLISPGELLPQLNPSANFVPAARRPSVVGMLPKNSPFQFLSSGANEKRKADVELIVRLGTRKPGENGIDIDSIADSANGKNVSFRKSKEGKLVLQLGRTQVEIQAYPGIPRLAADWRQTILEQFRAADTQKLGYLVLKQAQEADFFPSLFSLLDRNGDGKLAESELIDYLDHIQTAQARAIAGVTAILVSDEEGGLFELLDTNRDGKLGLRELRAAPEILAGLPPKENGVLTRENMPRKYRIALGSYQASFNPQGPSESIFTPVGMPLLVMEWPALGPAWFRKMDRNRDGDVSRREFLGTQADFERLDANGDGLISLEEALRADQKLPADAKK